jgi:hypothetical protein
MQRQASTSEGEAILAYITIAPPTRWITLSNALVVDI